MLPGIVALAYVERSFVVHLQLLEEEMSGPVHALSLDLQSPSEELAA